MKIKPLSNCASWDQINLSPFLSRFSLTGNGSQFGTTEKFHLWQASWSGRPTLTNDKKVLQFLTGVFLFIQIIKFFMKLVILLWNVGQGNTWKVRWPTTVTAITNTSRQNQKAHGETKKLTAKPKSSRQNQKAHGETKNLTAKPKSSTHQDSGKLHFQQRQAMLQNKQHGREN